MIFFKKKCKLMSATYMFMPVLPIIQDSNAFQPFFMTDTWKIFLIEIV